MALAAQPEASTPITSVAGLFGQNAATTPIASLAGLFGQNAATNAGRSFVDLFTPSQADEGDQSDPAIEARTVAPTPLRDLATPLRDLAPAPLQDLAPTPLRDLATPLRDLAPTPLGPATPSGTWRRRSGPWRPRRSGTWRRRSGPWRPSRSGTVAPEPEKKGADEGNGLVRNSLKFSPDTNPDTILPVGSKSGAGAGGAGNLFQGIKKAVDSLTGGGGSLTGPANATDRADKGGGES